MLAGLLCRTSCVTFATCYQRFITSLFTKRMSKLSDYGVVGLDLDNTLVEYNLEKLVQLEYGQLRRRMIRKGYEGSFFPEKMGEEEMDFAQKGLFIDIVRGNVVKLGAKGEALRASHGTRALSRQEIEDDYKEGVWEGGLEYARDPLAAWNGPLAEKVRPFLDPTDYSASYVFARVIDSHSGKEPTVIWRDLLRCIVDMFSEVEGSVVKDILARPGEYVLPTSPEVLAWLASLKSSTKLLLVTGSGMGPASAVAELALGPSWPSMFDAIVFLAKKPAFFTETRSLLPYPNLSWSTPTYLGGNWEDLLEAVGSKGCSSVYVGDNLIQDVYAPSVSGEADSVAVVKELEEKVESAKWGRILGPATFWAALVSNHAKACVPSLGHLARLDLLQPLPQPEA